MTSEKAEWDNIFNPFNSIKVLAFAKRMQGIVNEDYYPPVVVNLDVTGKCQYNCPHCHHRHKQVKGQLLPDLPKRLAETFPYFMLHWERDGERPLGCCIVGSQGDALLYPGLGDLLRRLYFHGVDVGLVTNGYGWTDELIDSAAHYCKFIGHSMDAGSKDAYNRVHRPPKDGWERSTAALGAIADKMDRVSKNDTAYKFLVLPDSYDTLYEGCRKAKELGVRWVQIRPADLSEQERGRINVAEVNRQIDAAMKDFNDPGVFDIVAVRHKFNSDFTPRYPSYCYLTALTVTITSDGRAWPCVDRRCDEETLLADCGKYGWAALRDAWGTAKHIHIVHDVINNGGDGPKCGIRCSNYGYTPAFDQAILADAMDINMI